MASVLGAASPQTVSWRRTLFVGKYFKTSCQGDHPHATPACCNACFSPRVLVDLVKTPSAWPPSHGRGRLELQGSFESGSGRGSFQIWGKVQQLLLLLLITMVVLIIHSGRSVGQQASTAQVYTGLGRFSLSVPLHTTYGLYSGDSATEFPLDAV